MRRTISITARPGSTSWASAARLLGRLLFPFQSRFVGPQRQSSKDGGSTRTATLARAGRRQLARERFAHRRIQSCAGLALERAADLSTCSRARQPHAYVSAARISSGRPLRRVLRNGLRDDRANLGAWGKQPSLFPFASAPTKRRRWSASLSGERQRLG